MSELIKAIASLEEAFGFYSGSKADSQEQKAFRDACIQRFEYCIELSWKISMKLLGSSTLAAKPAIREMARNNLILNPTDWIDFIEARSNTSHSYDEDIAKKVFQEIQKFIPNVKLLIFELQKINK